MDQTFDLFGDPVPANHGRRGRPQHIPTQENRNKVNMLLALGWSNERLAAALRVTQPTLRRHYFSEIKFREVARDRLDATFAMTLWAQVQAGNVGAMREFQKLCERNDVAVGHRAFYDGQRPDAAQTDKLGKKDLAAVAAETAGENTEWGNDLKPPGPH